MLDTSGAHELGSSATAKEGEADEAGSAASGASGGGAAGASALLPSLGAQPSLASVISID
jgi:hypothetical protein